MTEIDPDRAHLRTGADQFVRVDVAGFAGSVHVRDDGPPTGPTLLLVHGFSGSLAWFDSAIPLLVDTYRVVRIDLLGHGTTRGPAVDAPVQARVVDAVLAALGVGDVTAVGHSFGADVAAELAETSARVGRLVIVCQAPDYSDANLPRGNLVMTHRVRGLVLHTTAKGLFEVVSRVGRRASSREVLARARRDFRALNTAMFRVILVDRRDRMAAHPLDEQVRAAGKPTLVVLGGRDHFYGDRSAARYRAAGAHVEVLPEAGHSPFVDMPEQVTVVLRAFLDQPEAAES